MALSFLDQYRTNLNEALNRPNIKKTLERLQQEHSIFEHYTTTESLRNLISPNNKNYSDKDVVMIILLKELKRSNVIYPLITFIFWDSLYKLYNRRRSHVDDHEELFCRIQWDFYQTVMSHDVERLPRKIDVNIFLNTKKRVIAWEKENVREDEALKELDALSKTGLSPSDLEVSKILPEEMDVYLLDMVYRKVISETQYGLLLETLVYNRMSQKEWAMKMGIPHTTVRTLKHRAEKAIRKFERKRRPEKM
jgi:transposase